MRLNQKSLLRIRKSVFAFGLFLVFVIAGCASTPQLNSKKETKSGLWFKTVPVGYKSTPVNASAVRTKMNQFRNALGRGSLTAADWKLHDELLETYVKLKNGGQNIVSIPPRSRVTIPFESYCLNSGKAAPSEKEVYHWQKGSPGIPYYHELLKLRRQKQIQQQDLQTLIWNLQNETRWDDYPNKLKAILQRIDPQVSIKLPSRIKDQATSMITDSVLGVAGVSDALNTFELIEGKYYDYEDFRRSVESVASKYEMADYDSLTQIPDTQLFSQSDSDGYSRQTVTFYNPSDRTQSLNLNNYYLSPERQDVQRVGINPVESEDQSLVFDLEKLLYTDMLRLGIGFTPGVNDVADVYELLTGKDFVNGSSLSTFDRVLSGVGVVIGSGGAYRYAKKTMHAPAEHLGTFAKGLEKPSKKQVTFDKKTLDEANDALSKSSEFYESAKKAKPVSIPRGTAVQDLSKDAIEVRAKAQNGQKLYRVGTRGQSKTGSNAQFWSLESPDMPGYADRYGIPPENVLKDNFVETATLKKDVDFVTRKAPAVKENAGGGIEVVVPESGVTIEGHYSREEMK
ncbi:MAG: hypothetical protein JNL11_08215 [Bdellovibrionaceae bacterium]|nr:hypothetical protein [Pseudobdellovibrionaceae bacterium]